jgi:L-rhamnose-H+ transport protein
MTKNALGVGLVLIILGGVMEGGYSLLLKYTPKWKWENTWGAGSLAALVLVPWPLAILTVPGWWSVYRHSSPAAIVNAILFGAGWGIGGVFFGLGIAALGMSVGLSLIMGIVAIGGSIVPLLMKYPEQLLRRSGLVLMAGIGVMMLGLWACARAGRFKEESLGRNGPGGGGPEPNAEPRQLTPFKTGLIFCIASGVLSALVNFGFIFGQNIADAALQQGATAGNSPNAIWALVFTSNYLVNVGYCVYLGWRHKTLGRYRAGGTSLYWLGAVAMGVLWAGGIVVYGMGAMRLGRLGAFLGYPIMLISSILTGNVLGVLTGEWKGASGAARKAMALGVCLLMAAIVVLADANP